MTEPNSKQPSRATCKFHREQLLPAPRPQLQTKLPKQLVMVAELSRLTDGSSFLKKGERKVGAVMVDGQDIIWATAARDLSPNAESIALIKALELSER